jgi:hypothetical protein
LEEVNLRHFGGTTETDIVRAYLTMPEWPISDHEGIAADVADIVAVDIPLWKLACEQKPM